MSLPKPYYDEDGITIYHGDAREILPEVLPCDMTGCWLMDPPYSSGGFQEAGRASGSLGKTGEKSKGESIAMDRLSTRAYMNLMRDVLRHSRMADEVGVFTDWRMWVNTSDAIEYAGFMMRAMVVWAKPLTGIGRPWLNCHELLAYGMRGSANKDRVGIPNVIHCHRSGNAMHPTEKPLELILKILNNMEGDVVVDPFMGSGTTLVAAKQLGRRAIGIDIEEEHCRTAVERLAQKVLPLAV